MGLNKGKINDDSKFKSLARIGTGLVCRIVAYRHCQIDQAETVATDEAGQNQGETSLKHIE